MPIPYTKPAPPTDDKRWKIVATRMRRLGDRPEALIEAGINNMEVTCRIKQPL